MLAFIGDIHLGTKLPQVDYLKSLDKFLGLIKQHKEKCHAIFVCGDVFDKRLSIEDTRFAGIFLLNLVCNNCGRDGKTHVPVKFIHGTFSHDYEQYKIFIPMLEKIDNVDIFYTQETCIGELTNGARVLYLPQLYRNFDYTEYFKQKYDVIVGHGPLSSHVKNPCPSANYEIAHSAEQLGDISKICVFGHYHNYTEFGDNVYYVGPWLRWRYGEDEPRRFFFCNDNFEVETHLNPFALEYKTIEIDNPDQLREIISTNITTPHRFMIHTDKEDLETYHAIMNTNKKNTNLKFQVFTNEVAQHKMDDKPNIESKVISSNGMEEPIESLIAYISEKYNIDASKEIHEYDEKINKNKE